MTEDFRLSCWRRVREFAVPPSMIETAAARRALGDWSGACAAAHVDIDFRLSSVRRDHGAELASHLRDDLRARAPDLLRWHLPRTVPDGLIRPGLTISLARYPTAARDLHLVARTPPAWASGGQRVSLGLWDGSASGAGSHPRARPHPRFRFDLHRHLWDSRRSGELRARCGAEDDPCSGPEDLPSPCAAGRWRDEAVILLRADGHRRGPVQVRLGQRWRLVLTPTEDGACLAPLAPGHRRLPRLPDVAVWLPPDLLLLRAGLLGPGGLHPLVAEALDPGSPRADRPPAVPGERIVVCRGTRHRIAVVDGRLTALDHSPDELRREELLAALQGTPLPCLAAIDTEHPRLSVLDEIEARLAHGDDQGARRVVEDLLGTGAVPRGGVLRDALDAATAARVEHGLYRAGMTATPRVPVGGRRPDRGRRPSRSIPDGNTAGRARAHGTGRARPGRPRPADIRSRPRLGQVR